jgi:5,10-methylenetetrahydromethanopterin reductase
VTIANALQATSSIEVGSEVLVPHLRHPLAQAAAIATVEALAPGRLYLGIGTGFTGRMAMGQRPLKWSYMIEFVRQLRALLAGEDVTIDGSVVRMLQPPGFGAARPIKVPILIGANGAKGVEIAREIGDGIIYGGPKAGIPDGFAVLQTAPGGFLLDEGEHPTSPRILQAAKPWFGLQYHFAYDGFFNGPSAVENLPYGADWLRLLEAHPKEVRHLHVHDRHTVYVNALDDAFVAQHPDALADYAAGEACTPQQLRDRVAFIASKGATRVRCRSFADWERDMVRWAAALGLRPRGKA